MCMKEWKKILSLSNIRAASNRVLKLMHELHSHIQGSSSILWRVSYAFISFTALFFENCFLGRWIHPSIHPSIHLCERRPIFGTSMNSIQPPTKQTPFVCLFHLRATLTLQKNSLLLRESILNNDFHIAIQHEVVVPANNHKKSLGPITLSSASCDYKDRLTFLLHRLGKKWPNLD